MTLQLRITARAAAEIERADTWWRKHRLSAPHAVRDDLKAAFDLLVLQPGIGEKVENVKLQGTRSLQLDRVRYDIYYVVRDDELTVLSMWHSNRVNQPRIRNRVGVLQRTPAQDVFEDPLTLIADEPQAAWA